MRRYMISGIVVVTWLVAAGCGESVATGSGHSKMCAGDGEVEESEAGTATQALSCNKRRKAAYSNGQRIDDITVVSVEGELVEIDTATQYKQMRDAAARDGVRLRITSGFRTMGEQRYLYQCYVNQSCNNGNLAAKPGYSNHQNGLALDLNTSTPGVYRWLQRHAGRYGFRRTVPSEKWHWEYRGRRPVSDRICGGGAGGSGGAKGTNDSKERYDIELDVNFEGANNPFDTGSSGAIADVYSGQSQKTEIVLTNKSTEPLEDVKLGYWIQRPFVRARNYRIYDDHPKHDKRSWDRNSADSDPDNPSRSKMGKEGRLKMHKLAPGESKKIVLELVGETYSVGRVDHADIRVWLKHIDHVYGEQKGFFAEPTNGNKFGELVRDYAEVDVLSRDHWAFRATHEGDTEGWEARGTADEFKLNAGYNALATHVVGNTARIVSPKGTRIDADRFDELVLTSRAHDGRHRKAIYWARSGETFSENRAVRFHSPGDSDWHAQSVDLSDHPRWSGTVTRVRIDVLDGDSPRRGDSGWYDVRNIYFQSPSRNKTSRPGAPIVD